MKIISYIYTKIKIKLSLMGAIRTHEFLRIWILNMVPLSITKFFEMYPIPLYFPIGYKIKLYIPHSAVFF